MLVPAKRLDLSVDGHPAVLFTQTGGTAKFAGGAQVAHVDFVLSHVDCMTAVSAAAVATRYVVKHGDVKSVLEIFGGSGWKTLDIQAAMKPVRHTVWDISPWCVRSIQETAPGTIVEVHDSYKDPLPKADWIDADYNQFTIGHIFKRPHERVLFNRLFKSAGEWVTIADSALYGTKRFRQNLDGYEKLLGREIPSWRAYYDAVAELVWDVYGFAMERAVVVKGYRCAFLVFRKGGTVRGAEGIIECREQADIRIVKRTEVEVEIEAEASDE